MHSTTFLYLTLLSGLGANGSPVINEKRQLVPFPANFPFQTLSGDQAGALSAIRSNNLGGFCSQLLGSGQDAEDTTEQALNSQDTHNILPRQSVNSNSNSNYNSNQGSPGNSNSYSYSSSSNNNGGSSQSNVNYNLNGVTVPKPLTNYRPDTIKGACSQFLGNNSGNQNPTPSGSGFNYISTGINGTTIQMNETFIEINSTAAELGGTTIDIDNNSANGTTININGTSIEISSSGVEINGTSIVLNGTTIEINGTVASISHVPNPAPSAVPPTSGSGSPPINSAAPLPSPNPVPSPAPSTGLNPGIYFQNAFYGSGTDSPLRSVEQPGLPPIPFAPGQFHAYRYACAAVCARTAAALAFTVKTDFRTNQCDLVIGSEVRSGDIIPVSGAQSGELHLEAWNKYVVQ